MQTCLAGLDANGGRMYGQTWGILSISTSPPQTFDCQGSEHLELEREIIHQSEVI